MLKSILQPVLRSVLNPVFGGNAGGETPSFPVALDAPISSDIASLARASYGFDRLVHNFTGNTVRLVRTNDNAEQDFGFTPTTGIFNYAAVDTWRNSSDVNVVRFYNQSGGSVTLNAVGSATFVISNVVTRFGTKYSNQEFSGVKTNGSPVITVASTALMGIGMAVTGVGIPTDTLIETVDSATQITLSRNVTVTETSNIIVKNGQLSRDSVGGVGCNLNGNAHFITSSNLTINTQNGADIIMLYSHNNRKIATNASTVYDGNSVRERLFVYGLGTNNFIRTIISGGNSVSFLTIKTSAPHVAQLANNSIAVPRFSQSVNCFSFNTQNAGYYSKAAKEANVAYTAQATTDIGNGTLNNGLLVIGTDFTNSTGAVSLTERANILFGGVTINQGLTDLQRFNVINKMQAIGQQHNVVSIDQLKSYFDDIVLHKDVNTTTGKLASLKDNTKEFDFNLPTIASPVGTPTFTPNYIIPNIGITGLRTTNDTDNHFYSNNITPPDLNGTIISFGMSESTGTNLLTDLAIHSASETSSGTSVAAINLSFLIGRDHGQFSVMMRPNNMSEVGIRYYSNRASQFGATVYDGQNQMMGKYNRNLGTGNFAYGETIAGLIRTPASWANHGANSLGLDAPVIAPVDENINSTAKDGKLTLQIARFKAPTGYPKNGTLAEKLPYSLQSENYLFLSQSCIIGHQDGSVCHTEYGGVVDNATGARFKSYHGIFQSYSGVRCLWAWTNNVLTDDEIDKININLYKLLN